MGNWVVGYPVQTDREIDLINEKEAEKMWEKLNSHDDVWNKALDAVAYLNVVEELMDKCLDSLIWAQEEMNGTNSDYKIGMLIERHEDLLRDLRATIKQFTEGDVS